MGSSCACSPVLCAHIIYACMRVARNVCALCVALSESGGFAVSLLIFQPCGDGEKPSFGLPLSAFLAPCRLRCAPVALPPWRSVAACGGLSRLAPSSRALRHCRVLWWLVARPVAILLFAVPVPVR